MKFNKWILIGLFLFAIVSFGAVSANENITSEIVEQSADDVSCNLEVNEINEDEQTVDENNLVASGGEISSDNVTVEVSNVFKGQNTSISVTVPEATGTVNITVGEDIYTPEFINGVATQNISKYSIGLNNVTVKYNDIVKQTSFKGLDGIITNETFFDYYELIQGVYVQSNEVYKRYKMFDYIPEGAVLDFRGLIDISNVDYSYTYVSGLTVISSTNDVFIKGKMYFSSNCNIRNINFTGIRLGDNSYLTNSTIGQLEISGDCINISNVTVKGKTKFVVSRNNVLIQDCILSEGITSCYDIYIYSDTYSNITVKNCIGAGDFFNQDMHIKGGIIENNVFDGFLYLYGSNIVVRNNTITADYEIYLNTERPPHRDSILGTLPVYAIDLVSGSGTIVNNTIYTYGSDYAMCIYGSGNVIANNTLFSNRFGNDAVDFLYDSYRYKNVVINNTPSQIPVIVTNTKRILYDENVTIFAAVSAAGNVVIDVNGRKYERELVNGIASLTINEYHSGTNKIQVYYSDAVNDIYGYRAATFFVEKIDICPIVLEYADVIVGKVSSIGVTLPDDANGTITFRIFNSTHAVKIIKNANGRENTIRIPDLPQGNYIVNVTFTSDKYVTNSSSGNIRFIKNPVYKLTANNVVMDYNDGSKYKVLVTKDGKAVGASEVVKITFNGKTIHVKTDKNGYATLTLDAAPKTYTIKAAYMAVTKSSKVTIKNVLKAKSISKKKAKTVKFSATLKTSKGKAITGKKITFKLKGKTYSAKTNKKGVATISVKNLKVGKYTVNSKYGLCTVKNTITIKK